MQNFIHEDSVKIFSLVLPLILSGCALSSGTAIISGYALKSCVADDISTNTEDKIVEKVLYRIEKNDKSNSQGSL